MKSFATLSGGRTDQHDVTCRAAGFFLFLHLSNGMLNQREDAVQVNRERASPLRIIHLIDRHVLRWPHTVIGNQDVEPPEMLNRARHECSRRLSSRKITGDRGTLVLAQLLDQFISLRLRLLVTEHHPRTRSHEHSYRSRAHAPRTAGDESNFTRDGKMHTPSFGV